MKLVLPRALPRALMACPRALRLGALGGGAGLVVVLAWCVGFAWFAWASSRPAHKPPMADGIVVLTGGADRVTTALHLLAAQRAGRLLVSGVARGTELAELARYAGVNAAALAARTTLGHTATTTRGNAEETRDWVQANDIHTLIVVTAGYHMPRALIELGRVLPGVVLYPVPVQPPAMRGAPDLPMVRLLASEYTKWLAAELGLTRLETGVRAFAPQQIMAHQADVPPA